MSSRDELLHLINQYSFTIDSGDLEGFASLFEHGVWCIEGMHTFTGKQEVLDYLSSSVIIYDDGTPRTRHLTTNVDLTIDEESKKANSQCYVTVMQQTETLPLQPIFTGHYFDQFECVDEKWRYVNRTVSSPLMGDLAGHVRG